MFVKGHGGFTFGGMAAATLILAALLLSCTSTRRVVVRPPDIEGAAYVGNQVCFDCHTNIHRMFRSSPHAALHAPDAKMAGQSGCESCHGPASKHVAAGGGRGVFIVNPGKEPESCLQCHLETHAEFRLPQRHPVLEGRMNCVQCHDPHGRDIFKASGGLAMARLNEGCAECHREQSKPVVFEHEALREGCTACHQPHGSVNDKMLAARDNNLCLRCHAQVAAPVSGQVFIGKINHTPRMLQGSCWAAGCHTAVHGSNMDPKMRF